MLNCFVAVCAVGVVESVTFTVNVDVAAVVGVPVIVPLVAPIDNPAGRAPALMVQVSGDNPPVSAIVWLYATPTVPAGSEVVVIAGAVVAFTLMVKLPDVADTAPAVLESVTLIVKVAVPVGPLGVPVIAPVLPFKL